MEIFYTCAHSGKAKYQKYYDLVLKCLEDSGAIIVSPEKGNYLDVLSKKELQKYKDPKIKHYKAIKKGILYADAVVIEVSQEGLQLGHEATLAAYYKKHVLCLSLHEDFSTKIKNHYFHGAKYNEFNIEEIITDFINKVKGENLSERLNMFLSAKQLNYLEEAANKEGINKSEYIRRLIDKDRYSN